MYESTIIISTFFISWSVERIYYYCFHNNTNGILNLNTPIKTTHYPMNTALSNPTDVQYYSIDNLTSNNLTSNNLTSNNLTSNNLTNNNLTNNNLTSNNLTSNNLTNNNLTSNNLTSNNLL